MVDDRRRRILRGLTDLTVIHAGRLWTLYRAFDVETSQWVAARVIDPGAVEDYLLDELASDVETLRPVTQDPNLVTLHRLDRRSDGSVAVVTELCRGSFADRLAAEGPLPVPDVVRASLEAAAGLGAVHALGLAHGDVRPSKLLVSRPGATVVEGLCLATLALATRTAATPASPHSAPEIFTGELPSPAADVYGLASTTYHLILGRAAFEAFEGEPPASVILRIIGQPATPLRADGVPPSLSDLLAQAMSKDPMARPRSISEFAARLSAIQIARVGSPPLEEPSSAVFERGDDPTAGSMPKPMGRIDRGAPDPPPPTRNVLAPLTAGRGARPVPAHPAASDRTGTLPTGPEFAPPDVVAQVSGTAGSDVVAGSDPSPTAGPERIPLPEPGRWERGPARGVAAWVLLGSAAVVVAIAVLIVTGLL